MSPDSAPQQGWALFLDVDGTLLEFAETPQGVHVPASLKQLLDEVRWRLDGALALVSGRSLASLDQLFSPLRFIASGVHGCERRAADGNVMRPGSRCGDDRASRATTWLSSFAATKGLLLEDKHYALALHFRRAPEIEDEVYRVMNDVQSHLGPDLRAAGGQERAGVAAGCMDQGHFDHVIHAGSALRWTHAGVRRR